MNSERTGLEIAVIGLSGRFPESKNVEEFWKNLIEGKELRTVFPKKDENGEFKSKNSDSNEHSEKRIYAGGVLDDISLFDAEFFGFNPREAEIMDPQHRLFLEYAWEALENASYDPERETRPIGVYAGVSLSTYWLHNLYPNRELFESLGALQTLVGYDKDYVPTRVSYKLNLTGPSVSVQTSCSSSLVAVHLACQSLLSGECDMALAGGMSVKVPQNEKTLSPEGIISPDGHCRAFDHKGNGTIGGNGIGVVVLKRLEDAMVDRDYIYAIVKGSAINNDGGSKVGYTAPSETGQAKVIQTAQMMAEVQPETITYMEAHGTGTSMGDPIEVAAMTQAFRGSTDKKDYCAIGSVKTNVGHLDGAAGIVGFMKTVLSLDRKLLPPSINFETPNPLIDFENSPFYVNTQLQEWKTNGMPRRAGVSSFGIGGTNAHAILEEAPAFDASSPSRARQLLVISARTEAALDTATINISNYLKRHSEVKLADVAYTLQVGRKQFLHRRMLVVKDVENAVKTLTEEASQSVLTSYAEASDRKVVFMFTGQGSQYVNMARELYDTEAIFRSECDRCFEILQQQGFDLRAYIYPQEAEPKKAAQELQQTEVAQPALFAIEYALGKLWMSWGINPTAAIGHSIGEYVAACLAGVFSLEDALHLVLLRGQLMQQLPAGAMLSVSLPAEKVETLLDENLSLAASNAPSMTVVSGPVAAIEQFESLLSNQGINVRRLHTSHAFHSPVMEAIVEPFTAAVKKVKLNPPQMPFISNVTGTRIDPAEACQPEYWARHLRQPVRFGEGMAELLQDPDLVCLEVGPGRTLSSLAKQQTTQHVVLTSLRHPQEQKSDVEFLLQSLGQLWLAGVKVDWSGFYREEKRDRLPLPTYPFERQRYWIDPPDDRMDNGHDGYNGHNGLVAEDKKRDLADWFYIPSWKRSFLPTAKSTPLREGDRGCWLVFAEESSLDLVQRLKERGQDIIQVTIGENFSKTGEDSYTVNPAIREDYQNLLKEIQGRQPAIIAHCWGMMPEEPEQNWEKSLDLGFWSLVYLAQALGNQSLSEPLKIVAVTSNIQEVTGDEPISPSKATVLGPLKVIGQEYPQISCRNIDVIIPAEGMGPENPLIDRVIAEIAGDSLDPAVAYRGNHRWVQTFEPIYLEATENTRLRQGGVYLITGGMGGIGLEIAKYLAETVQAKFALVGRSPFPPKGQWNELLEKLDESDRVAAKIKKIREIEKLGAEVLVLSADVTDEGQMGEAVDRTQERFGRINGVIHAAGVMGRGDIQQKTPAMAAPILAPKVRGTLVLDTIFKDVPLDFLVLFSSISSFLGGLGQGDYAAANAFLDSFASVSDRLSDRYTVAIDWDAWQEVGMAMDMQVPEEMKKQHRANLQKAITVREGLAALGRILQGEFTQIIVTPRDFQFIIEQSRVLKSQFQEKLAQAKGSEPVHPRPNLANAYVAPRNDTEKNIAAIWQNLLGLKQIGIYDNFFDLGGNSLLGTQVIAEIKKEFNVEISTVSLFESPTVGYLAEIVNPVPQEKPSFEKRRSRGELRRERAKARTKK